MKKFAAVAVAIAGAALGGCAVVPYESAVVYGPPAVVYGPPAVVVRPGYRHGYNYDQHRYGRRG